MVVGYSAIQQANYGLYLQHLREQFLQEWNHNYTPSAKLTDFQKLKLLGTGAFGTVYQVKQITTGEYYAMKVLCKKKVVELDQIEHSLSEKKVLCSINFPFVVRMQYFFKDNVNLYFILPFINGGEMLVLLDRFGRFTETASKFYGGQILLALEYLHACGLVYRDLKPENIMIDKSGYVKITDFGFCKLILERTWTFCGTPDYLAPEVVLNKGYGKAVDWWAFGVLLYEMNAGFPPFYARDPMKMYENIVFGHYKHPRCFSKELKNLIDHLLQVDVTKRYGTLRNGVLDLKNHNWFKSINWGLLLTKSTTPPFIPDGDTKYFNTNFSIADKEIQKESSCCLYEEEFAQF